MRVWDHGEVLGHAVAAWHQRQQHRQERQEGEAPQRLQCQQHAKNCVLSLQEGPRMSSMQGERGVYSCCGVLQVLLQLPAVCTCHSSSTQAAKPNNLVAML